MAKSKSTRRRTRPLANKPPTDPRAVMYYQPGKGILIAGNSTFPTTADDKIICVKSIIQAMVAAHDAGALKKATYDIQWPLRWAVELLEQASAQIEKQWVRP